MSSWRWWELQFSGPMKEYKSGNIWTRPNKLQWIYIWIRNSSWNIEKLFENRKNDLSIMNEERNKQVVEFFYCLHFDCNHFFTPFFILNEKECDRFCSGLNHSSTHWGVLCLVKFVACLKAIIVEKPKPTPTPTPVSKQQL